MMMNINSNTKVNNVFPLLSFTLHINIIKYTILSLTFTMISKIFYLYKTIQYILYIIKKK